MSNIWVLHFEDCTWSLNLNLLQIYSAFWITQQCNSEKFWRTERKFSSQGGTTVALVMFDMIKSIQNFIGIGILSKSFHQYFWKVLIYQLSVNRTPLLNMLALDLHETNPLFNSDSENRTIFFSNSNSENITKFSNQNDMATEGRLQEWENDQVSRLDWLRWQQKDCHTVQLSSHDLTQCSSPLLAHSNTHWSSG